MSILVEQQDETIDAIQTAAVTVEKDTEVGCVHNAFRVAFCFLQVLLRLQYTDKAVASARAARKKRWICFIITLIILAIIGIVVGVEVSMHLPTKNSNNKSTTS
jgi:syntaxin 1B/2/3